jgi:hypothetical protein
MQVSRLLFAVENGYLNRWKGQHLNDIDIDGMKYNLFEFFFNTLTFPYLYTVVGRRHNIVCIAIYRN